MSAPSAPQPSENPSSPEHTTGGNGRSGLWRAGAGVITALVVAITVATCGGSDDPATPSTGAMTTKAAAVGAFPVTVQAANGTVTLDEQPESIVSLSPTATEMLFAIGAGPQVKAVDDQSTFPAEAPKTKLSGYQPNAEAVAKYDPDLVVLATDSNGIVDALTKLGIPVLELPAATKLADTYSQTTTLGAATGHVDDAAKVVTTTQDRLAAAVAKMPAEAKGRSVYHELDPTYYSITGTTFLGDVYTMLGLKSIADGAKDAAGGYPQLSAEFIVKAAPAMVVLADSKCCQQTPETVAARKGWDAVPAVQDGRVVAVDDDIASRWGPRVADFAEAVVAGWTK